MFSILLNLVMNKQEGTDATLLLLLTTTKITTTTTTMMIVVVVVAIYFLCYTPTHSVLKGANNSGSGLYKCKQANELKYITLHLLYCA